MQLLHPVILMLVQIRSFLVVMEEGSLHRAAVRLRLSQPALSRQMQALEHQLGGKIFERSSAGVKPTLGGYALAERMGPLIADYDIRMAEVHRFVRGENVHLRIGYLASAARTYLEPALAKFHQAYPKTTIKMLDLSPGEQVNALRRGELDLALTDQTAGQLVRDFYVRKLAVVPSLVGLPANHRLANRKQISLLELKNELFIGPAEADIPGYERWLTRHCRAHGKFRPRIVGKAGSLAEGISLAANTDAVIVLPEYAQSHTTCVKTIPLADADVTWDVMIVWRRGVVAGPLRALLDTIFPAKRPSRVSDLAVSEAS